MTIKLTLPLDEKVLRSLTLGQQVELTGKIYTARDAAHKYFSEIEPASLPAELNLQNAVIYHCGPVMVKKDNSWQVIAAGPTTSSREEPYMAKIIEKFSLRAVIGKGGMGKNTLEACKKFGCVYLHAVGGAAQLLANRIKKVTNVFFLDEFGAPEAVWELEVENFPAVLTMDANGNSLHEKVQNKAKEIYLGIS